MSRLRWSAAYCARLRSSTKIHCQAARLIRISVYSPPASHGANTDFCTVLTTTTSAFLYYKITLVMFFKAWAGHRYQHRLKQSDDAGGATSAPSSPKQSDTADHTSCLCRPIKSRCTVTTTETPVAGVGHLRSLICGNDARLDLPTQFLRHPITCANA